MGNRNRIIGLNVSPRNLDVKILVASVMVLGSWALESSQVVSVESSGMGLVSLEKRPERAPLPSSTRKDTRRSLQPRRGPH